jgi:molybdate transport system regulatory protein
VSQRATPLGVRLRIDFGPQSSIGPGKIALLEHIETSGSLSQAARDLGMSYRRAWLLLDDLNHALGEPVITTSVGGAGGGGAQVTSFGRKLVAAYRDLEHASRDMATERLSWVGGGLGGGAAPAAGASREARTVERRPLSRSLARHPPKRRRARPAGP